MHRILASTAVLIALATPTFATGYVAPTATPAPVPVPAPAGTDWTGFYVGLGYGHINYDEDSGSFEEESTQYSFFGGYLHDLGNIVVGAELEYMIADNWDVSVNDEDSLVSLSGRVGYDLGRVLPYVSLGIGTYDSSCCPESDMLTLVGVGADFQVTDSIRLGLNYEAGMNDEFDFGFGPLAVDVNTLSVRVMYNF